MLPLFRLLPFLLPVVLNKDACRLKEEGAKEVILDPRLTGRQEEGLVVLVCKVSSEGVCGLICWSGLGDLDEEEEGELPLPKRKNIAHDFPAARPLWREIVKAIANRRYVDGYIYDCISIHR